MLNRKETMLLKNIFLAGSATLTPILLTSILDANPSLYVYDKFFATNQRLTRSLCGKRIWITGASSGIGAELAKQMSHHGAHLVLSARDEQKLKSIAEECMEIRRDFEKISESEEGFTEENNIHILPMDVTASNDEIREKVQNAAECFKDHGIDILILNAGRGQLSPALLTDPDSTKELMNINFHAPINLALNVIEQNSWKTVKDKKRKGHIIVTSSVAAKLGTPLSSSYAGSKHAVHGYFTSLRTECGDWLRVDLPCPGPVKTNLSETAIKGNYVAANVNNVNSDQNSINKVEKKMSAERCARLILSSMIGPSSLFYETWIAEQPTLGFMYLSQYFPDVGNMFLSIIGKTRVKAWEENLPLYEIRGLMKAWKMSRKDNEK